jgi:hypothetical protein
MTNVPAPAATPRLQAAAKPLFRSLSTTVASGKASRTRADVPSDEPSSDTITRCSTV